MAVEESDGIDLTKEKNGGVIKRILRNGVESGVHPTQGDTVYVHYVGTLKDNGEKFDSSRDRNEPFNFTLGKGQVIKGWDLGVASMCRGELAQLECRADYAYGDSGSPPKIPPAATLLFEVELLRWEGEDLSPDHDRTITKSVIVAGGEKHNFPVDNAPVTVHAVGADMAGRVFYDRELNYMLGEGAEHHLPDGVDKALRRVAKGEKCRVTLKGQFAYGAAAPAEFGLAPGADVAFTLFLKDFDKVKASWEMLDAEKLEHAVKMKERGTTFLNQGKHNLALAKYQSVISLLEYAKPTKSDEEGGKELRDQFEQTFIAALLNSALVSLRMGESAEAIKHCDKVLEKQPTNVKALYRKAQALQNRKDYAEAIEQYKRVQQLDPSNRAAAQQILECGQQLAAQREAERKKYRGMFERMAKGTDSKSGGGGDGGGASAAAPSASDNNAEGQPSSGTA